MNQIMFSKFYVRNKCETFQTEYHIFRRENVLLFEEKKYKRESMYWEFDKSFWLEKKYDLSGVQYPMLGSITSMINK